MPAPAPAPGCDGASHCADCTLDSYECGEKHCPGCRNVAALQILIARCAGAAGQPDLSKVVDSIHAQTAENAALKAALEQRVAANGVLVVKVHEADARAEAAEAALKETEAAIHRTLGNINTEGRNALIARLEAIVDANRAALKKEG